MGKSLGGGYGPTLGEGHPGTPQILPRFGPIFFVFWTNFRLRFPKLHFFLPFWVGNFFGLALRAWSKIGHPDHATVGGLGGGAVRLTPTAPPVDIFIRFLFPVYGTMSRALSPLCRTVRHIAEGLAAHLGGAGTSRPIANQRWPTRPIVPLPRPLFRSLNNGCCSVFGS